jgi:pyruvate dehydrogenase (quinone)
MPPTIKGSQMAGFALYMARAVMNGRADELVDLAKTSLFR